MVRFLPPAGTPYSFDDVTCAIRALFDGDAVESFEEDICQLTGATTAIAVNTGRTAMTLALITLAQNDSRTEVIIPGYTCFTVPSAIRRAGLKAHCVDFAAGTMQYDLDLLKRHDTSDTLAIMLVYPFAMYSNPEAILAWAKERKIWVIEDVAQGMGVRHQSKLLGTLGDIGIYSFSKGKTITSVRGGVVVTNNEAIASCLREFYQTKLSKSSLQASLKVIFEAIVLWLFLSPARFGLITKLPFVKLGETIYDPDFILSYMSRPAAWLGRRKVRELSIINAARTVNGKRLLEKLAILLKSNRVQTTHESNSPNSLFLRLPLLAPCLSERNSLLKKGRSLGFSRMYGEPLSVIDDPALWSHGSAASTPVAEDFAHRLVTLPTHAFVTEADMDSMVKILES